MMRREGFELMVWQARDRNQAGGCKLMEPIEKLTVDVPEESSAW